MSVWEGPVVQGGSGCGRGGCRRGRRVTQRLLWFLRAPPLAASWGASHRWPAVCLRLRACVQGPVCRPARGMGFRRAPGSGSHRPWDTLRLWGHGSLLAAAASCPPSLFCAVSLGSVRHNLPSPELPAWGLSFAGLPADTCSPASAAPSQTCGFPADRSRVGGQFLARPRASV